VIDENRFTVEMSRGSAFSPPLYPWGFPLILAPFVAVLGADVDRLTIVPVLCAGVFACAWYLLAKPRIGTVAALTGVGAVTLTPLLLGWSELIQSEWPFLAVTAVVLVALDRAVASGVLTRLDGTVVPLVLLGLGAAASFSVRREGLAMVAAIAAAQVAALIAERDRQWWRHRATAGALAVRLLLPHSTALLAVGLLQFLLPSTLIPSYSGTGITNVWGFFDDHIDHLAEVAGLKRAWEPDPTIFGNAALGWIAVSAYLLLAAIGIVLALTRNRRRDLHLAAYAAVAFLIGGSFRVPINRYVSTVAPLLLLLAVVALEAILRNRRLPVPPTVVTTLALAAILAGNLGNANIRVDRATAFADAGRIEWGPTHPDALAMFEAVIELTDDDDVVAAPKARAMTLETGRRSVQFDAYRPMPTAAAPALIVTETGADVTDELLAQPGAYTVVWRNARFVLFQPSSSDSAATNGAGSSSTASP
jgi:4-amino-4-deoxy-L-arabinose transferase-like glycosyltransferase